MNARARLLLQILAGCAVFFSRFPAAAFDQIALPESTSRPAASPKALWSLSPLLDKSRVAAMAAHTPDRAQDSLIFDMNSFVPPPSYNRIAAGVSIALPGESAAITVKRIALSGNAVAQTWPRRPTTAFDVPTDHIFEAGVRIKF